MSHLCPPVIEPLRTYLRYGLIPPRRFFPGMGQADVTADAIAIGDYPFAPSAAYPSRVLRPADIRSVTYHGPCLLEVGKDFVFVSKEREDDLRAFAKTHALPERHAAFTWDFLLEPFLDTELTHEHHARLFERLAERGLSRKEVLAVREEVAGPMYHYNFHLKVWEWAGFGLYDVLSVMHAVLRPAAFADFYWRAMAIEHRGERGG